MITKIILAITLSLLLAACEKKEASSTPRAETKIILTKDKSITIKGETLAIPFKLGDLIGVIGDPSRENKHANLVEAYLWDDLGIYAYPGRDGVSISGLIFSNIHPEVTRHPSQTTGSFTGVFVLPKGTIKIADEDPEKILSTGMTAYKWKEDEFEQPWYIHETPFYHCTKNSTENFRILFKAVEAR